ncbi:hypothetical protein [Blastococcus mobilis]|nr:hypothetical protein [Blastococcus mobilis]
MIFLVNGAVLSSWAPRIPRVTAGLGLSDTELGVALFGVAAGSVPALLLTARALAVVKDTHLCIVAALMFSAALR